MKKIEDVGKYQIWQSDKTQRYLVFEEYYSAKNCIEGLEVMSDRKLESMRALCIELTENGKEVPPTLRKVAFEMAQSLTALNAST